MPSGWSPDPLQGAVVAPGWSDTPPDRLDPIVEVGWWAVLALDAALSTGGSDQALALQAIRRLVMWQSVESSQSMTLRKIAALALSGTAAAGQAMTVQRVAQMALSNVSATTQALGIVRVVDMVLAASQAPAMQGLALVRFSTLALSQSAPASTAMELRKIAAISLASSAPATQTLALIKLALLNLSASTAVATTAMSLGFPPTAETTTQFSTPGNYSYTFPRWADAYDVIICGAGAGGSGGSFFGNGAGGLPGQWISATWVRGVDIPWAATQATGVVGSWPSTACTATVSGGPSLSMAARSGTVGAIEITGQSPGNHDRNGKTYVGGATQGVAGNPGYPPGGGGAGGGWNGPGGSGAPGSVWYRAYQLT